MKNINSCIPSLYFLCGLPASGKSTYAKQLAKDIDGTIFSSDELRKEMYGDASVQGDNQKLFHELHKRIKECLREGNSCIYDATNIVSKRRRAFMEELNNINCVKKCVIIATPYEQCLINNTNRNRTVPQYVIEQMYRKWQTPHTFEGFDCIDIRYWNDEYYMTPIDTARSLIGFDQHNSHHSLSLGEHLIKTFSICKDFSPDILDACLVHDCGKPFTQTFTNSKGEPCEYAHYYGHEHVSAYESLFIVNSNSISTIHIPYPVKVSSLVTWHMQPYFWERNDNEKLHNKYKKIWGDVLYNKIMTLHEADKAAH